LKTFAFTFAQTKAVWLKAIAAGALLAFLYLNTIHQWWFLAASILALIVFILPSLLAWWTLRGIAVAIGADGIALRMRNKQEMVYWKEIKEIHSLHKQIIVVTKDWDRIPLPNNFRTLPKFSETLECCCQNNGVMILREVL
jgi:hypothetical protein